ncbi:MAG: hypothetical protein GQ564_05840 [Bacteroidales bacterium]|nr:hypothetical protein [Bacteroidales bacterium]
MKNGFVSFPVGMNEIIKFLVEKGWIVSIFNIEENELYNPINYLVNKEIYKTQYVLSIDTNIFSYIVNAYKENVSIQEHRIAIALVVFCQFAEIKIEVSLPVYEKIKFDKVLMNKSLIELDLFCRIDHSPKQETLINFALGRRDNFIINGKKDVSNSVETMIDWHNKYTKLEEWESTYLIILKLVELSLLKESNKQKFSFFMDWLYRDFRYSMVGIFYAFLMFSYSRKKGMMKYKPLASPEKKREQVKNMTWDLYFMIKYYRRIENKDINEEFLLASNDNVVKFLMKSLIDVNNSGDMNNIKKYLLPKDYELLEIYDKTLSRTDKRCYQSESWTYDYMDRLITHYEEILLI